MILALAMLAQTSQAAPSQEPYRAVGEDAPWTLTIEPGRMRYEEPGRSPVLEDAPAPTDDQGLRSYSARRWSAMIMPGVACRGADGTRYTDSVFVTIGQEEHSGCGGQALPADTLAGTSWLFTEIDGQATELTGDYLRDDRFVIDFHVGGFVGYGGCNRFSGGYSQAGDLITPHAPLGRGVRNCGPPVSERETRLLRIMAQPFRISRPDGETMVLTGQHGTVRLRHVSTDDSDG